MSEPAPASTASAESYDIVVVGGGNAGFSAAHAAREAGASVLLLEKAGADEAGGNSFYTAGAFRVSFESIDELLPLLDDETKALLPRTVVPAYPESEFFDDMDRVTEGRCDPVLTRTLVTHSTATLHWLHRKGLRFRLMYERQSFERNGEYVFFGGLHVGSVGGGKGLVRQHTEAAAAEGVVVRYGALLTALRRDPAGRIAGLTYADADGRHHAVRAGGVVLAAGGFQADPDRRERYLGTGWARALVRGNPYSTGEVLDLALEMGAARHGDWASCHSVAWDSGAAPGGGNRELTNQLTRQSYPLGIVVNLEGRRFIDEGADYRNYTYAKYGREILRQPEGRAFQLFDAKTRPLLRTQEYDSTPITSAQADTLEELARLLGMDAEGLCRTVDEFNASIVDVPFDPAVKDGRAARVQPPKSHWAQALDSPPYFGFGVACGITFTFGGLHVDEEAAVLDESGARIPGLFCAGEMVGGLFSGNYPGGTGLTSGAVFGRLAGANAATMPRSAA